VEATIIPEENNEKSDSLIRADKRELACARARYFSAFSALSELKQEREKGEKNEGAEIIVAELETRY